MKIKTRPTRLGQRFYIQNEEGEEIAWFDNLETAGTVARYLKGAPMTKDDSARAVEAMREFDAVIAAGAAKEVNHAVTQ